MSENNFFKWDLCVILRNHFTALVEATTCRHSHERQFVLKRQLAKRRKAIEVGRLMAQIGCLGKEKLCTMGAGFHTFKCNFVFKP
jgi:hypothetical protein